MSKCFLVGLDICLYKQTLQQQGQQLSMQHYKNILALSGHIKIEYLRAHTFGFMTEIRPHVQVLSDTVHTDPTFQEQ